MEGMIPATNSLIYRRQPEDAIFNPPTNKRKAPSALPSFLSLQHLLLHPPRLLSIQPLIITLHLLDNSLHLPRLPLPLLLTHLSLLPKQLLVRFPVAATQTIPQRGELAIVVVEVKMVHGVAGGAVDDGGVGDVLAVVDEDGPDVDEDEEGDVGEFLEREEEGEDVVGQRLGEAVDGVEGVRGEGGGHDPFVVRFVQAFVDCRVVEGAVDPVDAEVGEEDEDGELEVVVQWEGRGGGELVEFGVAADFGEEEWGGEDGHDGHGDHGLFHFEADLVLEVFRVGEGCMVEDEKVGRGRADKVDDEAKDPVAVQYKLRACGIWSSAPGNEVQTQGLSVDKVSGPCALVSILRWLKTKEAGRRSVGVYWRECGALA
jgi:hypothetical protein